jgi:beta-mannosidase
MLTTDLHDGWTLQATAGPVPQYLAGRRVATQVPGTAHTDLLAAGLIDDPYLDCNESQLSWMHRAHWRYESALQVPPPAADERTDLVFEGLDTVATITLADALLGNTFNQHRTYRFDVRAHLFGLDGAPAALAVQFASALEYAESEADRIDARPAAYGHPFNMVRKMACSFGWDWGPDLQTAGIWRPVRLERWRTARLAAVRPLVTIENDGSATVAVHLDVEHSGLTAASALIARATLARTDGPDAAAFQAQVTLAAGAASAVVQVTVPDPALWWPAGYGEQPLYDLGVDLADHDGIALGRWDRRIGLRTVALDTADDEHGTAFVLRVNETPVFVKGANWIPDDHLLTRITRAQLARRIDQAVGANLNLLRVWGSGIYESDDFYDLCDRAGVMVWQDFLLACAAYPEEEPHRTEIEAEAREHITRLTPHPSLVLWNGGNENLWGYVDWDWQQPLAGRTWGHGYYTDVFPRAVAELDPTRPYGAGSPYSPRAALDVINPNNPDHGTHHQWEVWNRLDYTAYREEIPRFCSEFGFQGPPSWHTLTRAIRTPDGGVPGRQDPVWLLHQKAEDGNGKLDRGLAPHLGIPDDFTDWHWATQLNQARAVAYAITHYRSWWPRTAGAIVWQLNDCWPVTSWAAVDGDEVRKPLWWALRHAFAGRILTVQTRLDPDTGRSRLVLAVVNDTDRRWTGMVRARREQLGGRRLATHDIPVDAAARSVALLDLADEIADPDDPSAEVLVAELDDPDAGRTAREVHCWVEDVDLHLDPDPAEITAEPIDGGYRVTVTARSLIKDLTVLIDRLDASATVDDALVTLPAGASATLQIRSVKRGLAQALIRRPVLRTANDLREVRSEGVVSTPGR